MLSRRIAIALGTGCALAWPAAAVAAVGTQSYSSPGGHVFVVPAGVKALRVTLVGGRGGNGDSPDSASGASIPGGAPSTVMAILAVTPGQRLYAEVGGDGGPGEPTTGTSAPGVNGGGAGGEIFALFFGSVSDGGGGGGASDIRRCPPLATTCNSLLSRLIVAGGGGGGAGSSVEADGGSGGPGDGAGVDGQPDGHGDAGGGGGGPGTTTAGGALGTGGGGYAGSLGFGGSGQATISPSPGGGGGGLYGGGAGGTGAEVPPNAAGAGGGGGGSSGVPAGAKGVTGYQFVPTATGAQPIIRITWTLPAPTVSTGVAEKLTPTGALLTGHVDPNGYPLTRCQFLVGGRSVSCAQSVGAGTAAVLVSAPVTGLHPATTYPFRLSATSANGSATGADVQFRTP